MPQIEHVRAGEVADRTSVWEIIDRDGAVIVEDFIAPDLLRRLATQFAPLIEAHRAGSATEGFWTDFHGEQTKRVTGLASRSPAWVELLADERYLAMVTTTSAATSSGSTPAS